MQAYTGLMSVNGHPDQEPARVGTSIIDMGTGMWAALGVVAACGQARRDRTRRRGDDGALRDRDDVDGLPRHGLRSRRVRCRSRRARAPPMIAPYQAFPTVDGYALIGAASDGLFTRLVRALGCPELATATSGSRDNPARVSNRPALVEELLEA